MGPRFRQNNYRGSQRVRVRTVAAVIALPSIPPGWPTFSYDKQLPEGIKGQQQPAASRSTSQCGFEECFPLKLELDGEGEREKHDHTIEPSSDGLLVCRSENRAKVWARSDPPDSRVKNLANPFKWNRLPFPFPLRLGCLSGCHFVDSITPSHCRPNKRD